MLFTPNPLADDDDDVLVGIPTEDFSDLRLPIDPFADYDDSVEEDDFNSLVMKNVELEKKLQATEIRKDEEKAIGMDKVRTHRLSLEQKKNNLLSLIPEEMVSEDQRNSLPEHVHSKYEVPLAQSIQALRSVFSDLHSDGFLHTRKRSDDHYSRKNIELGFCSYSRHIRDQLLISGVIENSIRDTVSKLERDSQDVCQLLPCSPSSAPFCPEVNAMAEMLRTLSTSVSSAMSSSLSLLEEVATLEKKCCYQFEKHSLLQSDISRLPVLFGDEGQDGSFFGLEKCIQMNKSYQRVLDVAIHEVNSLFSEESPNTKSGIVSSRNSHVHSIIGHIVDLVSLRSRRDDLIAESRRLGGMVLKLRRNNRVHNFFAGFSHPFTGDCNNSQNLKKIEIELQRWMLHLISRNFFLDKKSKSATRFPLQNESQSVVATSRMDGDGDERYSNPLLLSEISLLESFLLIQDGCLHAVAILHDIFIQYAYNAYVLLSLASMESDVDPILAENLLEMESLNLDSIESETMCYLNLEDTVNQLRKGCNESYNMAERLNRSEVNHWKNLRQSIEKMLQINPFFSKLSKCPSRTSLHRPPFHSAEENVGGISPLVCRFSMFSPIKGDDIMLMEEEEQTGSNLEQYTLISVESMEHQRSETEKRMKFFDQQPYASLLSELRHLQIKNAELYRLVGEQESLLNKEDTMDDFDRKDMIDLKKLEESWSMLQYELEHISTE